MMRRIVLVNGQSIMEFDPGVRYIKLEDVKWDGIFVKTYIERRTWLHVVVNFVRIWIIHFASFWYFIAYNAPFFLENKDEQIIRWSCVALGGVISTIIMFIGVICEFFFVPNRSILVRKPLFILFLFIILIINSVPIYYMIYPEQSSVRMIQLSILISLVTTLTFIIISSSIFGGPLNSIFAANFAPLSTRDRIISIGFWCCVFGCKLLGSYFFLSLSFKDSL